MLRHSKFFGQPGGSKAPPQQSKLSFSTAANGKTPKSLAEEETPDDVEEDIPASPSNSNGSAREDTTPQKGGMGRFDRF